jgi:hypothetical protein
MSEKVQPRTPDDVTALAHRHLASNALYLLMGAENHLRAAGYVALADQVAALIPAVKPLT